jgi:4-hydroxybutyrate CoA-transferase
LNKSSPEVVTAEKAIEAVKSHNDVVLANFCGEPRLLPMALMNRAHELLGVRIFHYAAFGPFQDRYLEPGMEKHIRCATAFCGRRKSVRQLLSEGRADFYPVTFGNTPRLLREGDFRSDVLLLTVSPPGRDGYCSLGVSVDYAKGALERPPRVVIAEVNPNMPKTHGRSFIHVSKIDHIVEVDQPLYELEQSPITEIQVRIGQHVAALVEDCSTLQIGYGGVSEAMVHFLQDKKNLGIHTEMVPEGLRELVAAGAITNARKSIHQGKIICTFHGGTTKLYEWLNDNPSIEMQPVDYTNDPKVIAMNSKMVAINAALQVDLFGNIYSDLLGLDDQYTGSGGQLDFAIGCTLAHEAKFVTVLPSTTSDEKSSRIVTHPTLEINNPRAPQIPTIPRYYADYVVTEYGVAHLKGRPNTERAKALIQIAHPDFQGILQQQAKELGLL